MLGVGLLLACIGFGGAYHNLSVSTHNLNLPSLPVSYTSLAVLFTAGVAIYGCGTYKAFKDHYSK